MTVRATLCAVLLSSWLAAPAWGAPEGASPSGPALIELAAGPDVELIPSGSTLDVLVPINPGPGLAPGTPLRAPVVRHVSRGNQALAALRQKIRPSFVFDAKGQLTDLQLTLDLGALVEPGTYDVTLSIEALPRESGTQLAGGLPTPSPRAQLLTLQLVHPHAVLAARPLRIERVEPFVLPLLDGVGQALPRLLLEETSRRSQVTGLALRDERKDERVGLVFTPPEFIRPGGLQPVEYAFEGVFPLGSEVGGTVTVHAPQLAAPAQVTYSITTRLSRVFIFVPLVMGLVLGFLLRTRLTTSIDVSGKQLESLRYRAKLEQERGAHPDALLGAALRKAEGRLKLAEDSGDMGAMNQALAEAQADVERALQELGARRTALKGRAEELLSVLERPWVLPAPVKEELESLRELGLKVRTLLEKDDVASAAAWEKELSTRVDSGLRQRIDSWRSRTQDALERLRGCRGRLSPSVWAGLEEPLGKLSEALRQQPEDATAATAGSMLENIHSTWALLRDFLGTLRRQQLAEAEAVMTVLPPGLHPPSFQAFQQRVEALRGLWSDDDALGRPSVLDEVTRELARLADAMLSAIRLAAPPENKSRVEVLLAERGFEEAARAVGLEVSPRVALSFHMDEEPGLPRGAPPSGPAAPPQASPAAPRAAPVQLRVSASPPPDLTVEQQIARTFSQQLRARVLQWAFSAAIIVATGYVIYAESFKGTASDFSTIFFWAFGLDVGVSALAAAAGRAGTPKPEQR